MNPLHNESSTGDNFFVPKVGQRDSLCSNKKSLRCPTFGIKSSLNQVPEDVALDYFASILVEAFMDHKEYERNKLRGKEASSDLCPSINEGTS